MFSEYCAYEILNRPRFIVKTSLNPKVGYAQVLTVEYS